MKKILLMIIIFSFIGLNAFASIDEVVFEVEPGNESAAGGDKLSTPNPDSEQVATTGVALVAEKPLLVREEQQKVDGNVPVWSKCEIYTDKVIKTEVVSHIFYTEKKSINIEFHSLKAIRRMIADISNTAADLFKDILIDSIGEGEALNYSINHFKVNPGDPIGSGKYKTTFIQRQDAGKSARNSNPNTKYLIAFSDRLCR